MNSAVRLLVFASAISFVVPAAAQQGRMSVALEQNLSHFVPPPRALSQQLKEAEQAIDDERYGDAIVILGDLLERSTDPNDDQSLAGQDFFLESEDGDQQRMERSFLRSCRSLIGSLPDAAFETYQLRYGALAEKMLDQATESRDWNLLREVRRKYFHTRAGYQASVLLAKNELALGHPLAASLLLDDLVQSRRAVDQLGRDLLVLHAVSCRSGGRSIPRELLSQDVTFSDPVDGSEQPIDDLRQWISSRYEISSGDTISRSRDYPMLGGNTSRNDTADGQLPLSSPRWMLETTATPLEEQQLREATDDLMASGRLFPPSWTPIVVGDQLLMRTTERLRGVDYRTGKRVWQYPWSEAEEIEDEESEMMRTGMSESDDKLTRRVWNDFPYGQITSDGKRVYLLDDLAAYRVLQISPLMGIRDTRSADSGRNTLVALELETEGKMLWRLGQNPTIESELNDAFFLGAPIEVDGSLYCMVELAGDILLACLDPATGQLRWMQQLVAIEGAGIQYDPIRRVAGATPTYHEGVLICPTGAGATVAVDLADRMLRWGTGYQRRSGGPNLFNNTRVRQSSDQMFDRWQHAAAIASGTSVLVTPVATDNLFCFDLVDGKQRFRKARQASFYVAGIRDGRVLMVGPREIVSYGMDDGGLQWSENRDLLSPGQQIIGRGVFGPDCYIVPTSNNELLKVSLEDGKVIERRTTRYPLGNLIAVDGEIISQGPTRLAVALGARTLGPRVERMLAENPNDLDALIQKALLLSERGERTEALEVLQRARRIDPDSDDVLLLSINSMLGELRENPSPPEGLEEELDALIDTPTQRLEFLALRTNAALRNGDALAAVTRLLEFSTVLSTASLLGNEDESILRDPTRDCSLESWLAARSADIVALAKESDRLDEVNGRVSEHLENRGLATTKSLSAVSRQLHPLGIDEVLIALAERHLTEGELLYAERLLLGMEHPEVILEETRLPFSPSRAAVLARAYRDGQMNEDAKAVCDAVTGSDDAGDLAAELETIRETVDARAEEEPKLDVTQPITLTWQPQASIGGMRSSAMQSIVQPSIQAGQSYRGWSIVNNAASIAFQSPSGGFVPLPIDEFRGRRSSDRKATISGGLMILERPGRVSAIDLFAMRMGRRPEALLWTRDFGADSSAVTKRSTETTPFGDAHSWYPVNTGAADQVSEFRVGPVLGDRVMVLHAGELVALDARSGDTLWRNAGIPGIGHMVFNEHRVALVSYEKDILSSITYFNVLDGQQQETKPWEHGKIWSSNGRYLLSYLTHDDGSAATVRLVDPFSGEVKLEIDAAVKSPRKVNFARGLGRILQDRYLVLFDSNGRLVIWDLLRATELCRHSTSEMPDLVSMHAMWMDGQIVVIAANEVVRQSKNDMTTQQGEVHRTAHRLIAVSTETGEVNWKRNFEQPWGITIDQPYGSPVLLLARSKTTFTINRSKPEMDVAMIRLSDGETIHEELEKEVSPRSTGLTTAIEVQARFNRLLAFIDGEQLLYEFNAQAAEPDDGGEAAKPDSDEN